MQTLKLTLKLGLIALVAAVLLAGAHDLTKQAIKNAAEAELLAALRIALPEFDNRPADNAITMKVKDQGDVKIYRGTKNNQATGYGFRWSAKNGFSGNIDFLIGLKADGSISGLSILKHSETPGLGAKITTSEFLAQFVNKNLTNTKWQVTKDGGDIDVITGATITPRALTAGIKEALEFFNQYKEIIATAKAGAAPGVPAFDPEAAQKAPKRLYSPSTACFNVDTLRYALTESPLQKEANACFDHQYETFGNCLCNFKFQKQYPMPEGSEAIRNDIQESIKLNNHDAAIQGYCALPQQERTKDDVLQMIKIINAGKHCLISMDCMNSLHTECPVIAAHADPNHPIEKVQK